MKHLLAAVSVNIKDKPYIYIFGSGGSVEKYCCTNNISCSQANTIFGYSLGANGALSVHLEDIKRYIRENNRHVDEDSFLNIPAHPPINNLREMSLKELFDGHASRIVGREYTQEELSAVPYDEPQPLRENPRVRERQPPKKPAEPECTPVEFNIRPIT